MARTYTPRLADPAALWTDMARMYDKQATEAKTPEKATEYTLRAIEAREKAAGYRKP